MTAAPEAPPIDEVPDEDETTTSLWILALVGIVVAFLVLTLIGWLLGWGLHWLYNLWFNYEWPSDKGNGPEAVTELVVLGVISAIVVPPIRRWFVAKFQHVHRRIDEVHETVRAHHEEAQADRAELHRKFDHIIRHSSVPDLPPKP